jgi:hypothetical protein
MGEGGVLHSRYPPPGELFREVHPAAIINTLGSPTPCHGGSRGGTVIAFTTGIGPAAHGG